MPMGKERTKEQLYREAKRLGIKGRSKMNKGALRAVLETRPLSLGSGLNESASRWRSHRPRGSGPVGVGSSGARRRSVAARMHKGVLRAMIVLLDASPTTTRWERSANPRDIKEDGKCSRSPEPATD
jgi:hypothetical protein